MSDYNDYVTAVNKIFDYLSPYDVCYLKEIRCAQVGIHKII